MQSRVAAGLIGVLLAAMGCADAKPDCRGGAQVCGGVCANLQSDNANCGACGSGCGPGTACSNGACVATCPAPTVVAAATPTDGTLVTADGTTTPRTLASRFADTVNVKDLGAVGDGTTDDTAAINAALCAAVGAGGGTIFFPVGTYLATGQLAIPWVGTPPVQRPIHLRGAGAHFTGGTPVSGPCGPNGGSVLDLRYAGPYGKLLTLGHGLLEIDGLSFIDGSGSATPFIYTTNTTLHVRGNGFFGSRSGQLCDQDAIVLGGTVAAFGDADPTHGFQGYGTVIERNYFDGIRRAVYGRVYANGVVVRANTIWANGGAPAGGAAIEFVGDPTDRDTGNNISENVIEMSHYPYGIKLTHAFGNVLSGNGFFDDTTTSLAGIKLAEGSGANVVIPGMKMANLPLVEGQGTYDQVLGPWNRLDVGGAISGADGEALRLHAGLTSDHAYLAMHPRSGAPWLRGGTFGYSGGAGSTEWRLENQIGAVVLDAAPSSWVAAAKPLRLAEAVLVPAPGPFTVDADAAQNVQADLATAGGSWSLGLAGGHRSALVTITIRNTSAGGVTLAWPGNVHLAAPWVNPGPGANRSLTLRMGDAWYEVGRTVGDVAN